MSKDHNPGSVTESVLAAGDPHPVKEDVSVTVTPLLWAALVVPLAALVIPVILFPLTPVYEISSVPTLIKFVPVVGKPVVLPIVISVAELLFPLVLSPNAPFKVVVSAPKILPPHKDIPQPNAPSCSAGPTW